MTMEKGTNLMDCLSAIDNPRRPSKLTLRDVREVLVMAIAAMLSDCYTVEDIARAGRVPRKAGFVVS